MFADEISLEQLMAMPEIKIDSDYAFNADEIIENEKQNGYICIHFEEFLEFWVFNREQQHLKAYGLEITHGRNWMLDYETRK